MKAVLWGFFLQTTKNCLLFSKIPGSKRCPSKPLLFQRRNLHFVGKPTWERDCTLGPWEGIISHSFMHVVDFYASLMAAFPLTVMNILYH